MFEDTVEGATVSVDTREKMIEYVKLLKTIEDAMEPYKESKRELRKDYIAQGWLDKNEIASITRAYRMLKKNERIEDLVSAYDVISSGKTQNDA
jgi:hypothetical protein